jgi:penicillin-insensitive murein endopeptidase
MSRRRGGLAALLVAMVGLGTPERGVAGPPPTAGEEATAAPAAGPPPNPWAGVTDPSPGPARSIGGYSRGCLAGGERLPRRGDGFRVAEPDRARTTAHPAMIQFLRDLGAEVKRRRLGELPIGDLSQPRGGPAPSGHASHQTGLDADIWYADGRGKDRPRKVAMVDLTRNRVTAAFGARVERIVAAASRDPRVDRIFVNPVIKRELCARAGKDREWLHKVRPWWSHHEHFHVRLTCPADSPTCEAQSPIAAGDGCAEVEWWLQPKAEAERSEKRKKYRARQGVVAGLPGPCTEVLTAPLP